MRSTTVQMEDFYYAAIEILKRRRKEIGFTNTSQNEVISTALSLMLDKYGIIEEDVIKELKNMKIQEEKENKQFEETDRPTRYRTIIDTLRDSKSPYDLIFYDHDTELPNPYRETALHKRSALQEEPGKGRGLHKKWSDVTAVRGDICDIVIEEDRQPTPEQIISEISIITKCNYLWTNNRLYTLTNPYLFILVNDNINNVEYSVEESIGNFRKVIVCNKSDFAEMYEKHYGT
jgi:hypothetical protein